MHLRRDFRFFVRVLGDLAAVIADRSRESVESASGQERDRAAHAEAHDADRTVLFQFADRRLHVAQHRLPIGAGDELARIGNLVGGVAGFEIRLLAIEHRRRHRSIAFAGEPVAYRPDVMIDAEDFLNKDNAAFGFAGRIGTIGAELETVRSGQAKMLTQFGPPSMAWSQVIAAGSLSAAPALLNPPW